MALRVVHVPMPKRMPAVILFALLCAPAASHAALYDFTLRGTVTGGFVQLVNVNIGDECTIRYVLDSTDLHPHPWMGIYSGTNAVLTFPNITIVGNPNGGPNLTVATGGPGVGDIVYYQTYPDLSNPDPRYGVQISFAFPDGTLASDALPLELPLSQATTSYFEVYLTHHPLVIGRVTSYSSVPVPEAGAVSFLLLAFAGTCARRRRRHR